MATEVVVCSNSNPYTYKEFMIHHFLTEKFNQCLMNTKCKPLNLFRKNLFKQLRGQQVFNFWKGDFPVIYYFYVEIEEIKCYWATNSTTEGADFFLDKTDYLDVCTTYKVQSRDPIGYSEIFYCEIECKIVEQ